jgi:hypothetical protein
MPEKLSTDIDWIKEVLGEIKDTVSCVDDKVDRYYNEVLCIKGRVSVLEENKQVWDRVKTGLIVAIVGGLVVGCTMFILGIKP